MSARAGVVYLVGAGPGDPGLMTARALELIASADSILYDRLIPSGALDGAREDAELVYVGKAPGDVAMTQDGINEALVERAQRGLSVVRLKGGDPFVFGRGGEEAEACRAAGVDFEVVPGVTAGVAAARLCGHSRHAPRRRLGGRVRHRPRGPGQARDRARLGGARALPWDARPLHGGQEPARHRPPPDRGGARSGRAGGRDRARHAARPEGRGGDARDARRRGRAPGPPAAVDPPLRPGRRAARGHRVARAPPAPWQAGGRDARARSGKRHGANARGARRRGGRAARDQDRADDRHGRGARRDRVASYLRARLRDEPERRAPPVRGDGGRGPRRARAFARRRWRRSARAPLGRFANTA